MKHLKIGEAAAALGVKPHVLRYWESEFVPLRPKKTRGSHRMYGPREMAVATLIQRLLEVEGYSLSGAKKQLRLRLKERASEPPAPRPSGLRGARGRLLELLQELDSLPRKPVQIALADDHSRTPTP